MTRRLLSACAVAALWAIPYAAIADDLLLIHGHIYTGNPRAQWAAAVAVDGTHIAAVGDDAQILRHRRGHPQIIDLHGQTVIPGIVDSHMHLLYGAYALHGLNLSTPESSITPDKPEILIERLKAYAAAHPQDTVLLARADFSTVPPTTPTFALLDRAVPDRPLVIHNTSEHALWLNSAALKLAGLTDRPVQDIDEEPASSATPAVTRRVCCWKPPCSSPHGPSPVKFRWMNNLRCCAPRRAS